MKTPDEIKRGLEACIAGECNSKRITCPYRKAGDCTTAVVVDALAYIRQLEERVAELEKPLEPMALDEAYEADYCYIEDNVKGSSEPHVVLLGMMTANSKNEKRVEIMEFGEDVDYCAKLSCEVYGKTWRCWPRRPTEAERKAAEWDV